MCRIICLMVEPCRMNQHAIFKKNSKQFRGRTSRLKQVFEHDQNYNIDDETAVFKEIFKICPSVS